MKRAYLVIILAMACSILFTLPVFANGYPVGKFRELDGNTYKIGDVNSDDLINAEDALEILKYSAKIKPLDKQNCFIGFTQYEWEVSEKLFDIPTENFDIVLGDDAIQEKYYYLTSQEALIVLQYAAKMLPDDDIWYSGKNMLVNPVPAENLVENTAWEITDYETYISSMNELVEAYGVEASVKDSFGEAFFTEEKLVVALVGGMQEDTIISFNGLLYSYKSNGTVLKLDAYVPAPPVENKGAWLVLLPVDKDTKIDGGLSVDIKLEQEPWVSDEPVEVDKEKVEVFSGTDMFYDKAEELSPRTPLINIISSYSEYEEYIASVKADDEYLINEYSEEYFDDNVIVVVGYYATDYSTDVSFYDIRQNVLDGKYQINIELGGSMISLPACRPWIIMIPFEGKDYTVDDFYVNYISVYKNLPCYAQCSKAAPIEAGYGDKGFKIISTYEDYQEYMELFLEANPDYEIKYQYTEEEFENLYIVAGGFWTFSGQLELKHGETILREGKMTIRFKGTCPNPFTEDSYYFHYMLSYDGLPDDKDNIEIVTDVEYYEVD